MGKIVDVTSGACEIDWESEPLEDWHVFRGMRETLRHLQDAFRFREVKSEDLVGTLNCKLFSLMETCGFCKCKYIPTSYGTRVVLYGDDKDAVDYVQNKVEEYGECIVEIVNREHPEDYEERQIIYKTTFNYSDIEDHLIELWWEQLENGKEYLDHSGRW